MENTARRIVFLFAIAMIFCIYIQQQNLGSRTVKASKNIPPPSINIFSPMLGYSKTTRFIENTSVTLQYGVNIKDEEGKTALMYIAATHEQSAVALLKSMILAGADVNAKDNEGNTALMFAAEYGLTESVKTLVESGADANAKNNYDTTVLLLSLLRPENDCQVLEILISAGVDVNTPDRFGKTALMWSIKRSYSDHCTVKMLLTAGADVNARDKYGKSVIEMAEVYLRNDIVATIKENSQ